MLKKDQKSAKRQAAMVARPRARGMTTQSKEEEEHEEEMKVSNSISSSSLVLHLLGL